MSDNSCMCFWCLLQRACTCVASGVFHWSCMWPALPMTTHAKNTLCIDHRFWRYLPAAPLLLGDPFLFAAMWHRRRPAGQIDHQRISPAPPTPSLLSHPSLPPLPLQEANHALRRCTQSGQQSRRREQSQAPPCPPAAQTSSRRPRTPGARRSSANRWANFCRTTPRPSPLHISRSTPPPPPACTSLLHHASRPLPRPAHPLLRLVFPHPLPFLCRVFLCSIFLLVGLIPSFCSPPILFDFF